MTNQRNAADRVRPFLQAMEQSINAARQRRLNKPSPATLAPPPSEETPAAISLDDEGRPRLRARPKRPTVPSYDGGNTLNG